MGVPEDAVNIGAHMFGHIEDAAPMPGKLIGTDVRSAARANAHRGSPSKPQVAQIIFKPHPPCGYSMTCGADSLEGALPIFAEALRGVARG